MNIQDVSEFLELVKNPTKYEAYLKAIVAEQDRLVAVIETVGKVAEIDAMRKKAQKELDKATTTSQRILDETQVAVVRQQEVLDQTSFGLRTKEQSINRLQQESDLRLSTAKAMEATFTKREKAMAVLEKSNQAEAERLTALVAEYNEKIAKLRSVMV